MAISDEESITWPSASACTSPVKTCSLVEAQRPSSLRGSMAIARSHAFLAPSLSPRSFCTRPSW
jgi:hypothetical protein